MEYKPQLARPEIKPRLIIHGGAGNITPETLPPARYNAYREALLSIVTKANTYMLTPTKQPPAPQDAAAGTATALPSHRLPSALDTACHALVLLEDNPLFNSARGAVFTRDGTNELEASVMVSRGRAKRAAGVMGLRRVRNPILLARQILDHGERDLRPVAAAAAGQPRRQQQDDDDDDDDDGEELDVPSAQGHTQIHGAAAEQLARRYGLEMVEPGYFFTQQRWDEHVRGLEREKGKERGGGRGGGGGLATWSADEFLPQGTCGVVALDEDGVVCCATSTGGMTNKLSGRIGDTPVVGAGFWAEEWTEDGDPTGATAGGADWGHRWTGTSSPALMLSESLRSLVADCLPSPTLFSPVPSRDAPHRYTQRSLAISGTGNGDSFLRINAVRTVAAMARFRLISSAEALSKVVGDDGELQKSAGDRWGRTGEGEGGMIGIESVVVRDFEGRVLETRAEILQDFNAGGMFRAWISDEGEAVCRILRGEKW